VRRARGRLLLALALVAAAWPAAGQALRVDGLAARLSPTAAADEHWDVLARFDSGHAVFFRMVVTNQGPGEQTLVGTGHVVFPDGRVHPFQVGRRAGDWSASPDGLRLKAGSALLDLRGPERLLELESQRKGIDVAVRFPAQPALLLGTPTEPAIALVPLAPAQASIRIRGFPEAVGLRGSVTLRHAFADAGEAAVARRWLDLAAGDADLGLVAFALTMPGGRDRRWLALQRDGALALSTADFELAVEGAAGPEPRYPMPVRLALSGSAATGEVRVGRELVRADPMLAIPQPFRWWLSRSTAPRRIWGLAEVDVALSVAGRTVAFERPGVLAVTWIQPSE
jgi:hypothetical protein